MKTYILITVNIILMLSSKTQAQVYDTMYHTDNKHEVLNFKLTGATLAQFSISTHQVKWLGSDILKNEVKFDTFSIQTLKEDNFSISYSYKISPKKWRSILYGKDCKPEWDEFSVFPTLFVKYKKEDNEFEFYNCEGNTDFIRASLKSKLDCIEKSEDKFMKKYALDWIVKCNSCEFQKSMLMLDLGQLSGNLKIPVPVEETLIKYSIIEQNDTLGFNTIHLQVTKEIDSNGHTLYTFSEDTSNDSSVQDKIRTKLYGVFKNHLSQEEQQRDSIRMNSISEKDITTILVNKSSEILKYESYIYSSMLNSKMQRTKSEYKYTIERIGN